jgi:hypothetical protein
MNRIFRIFFCHHQFPEEIDEAQSTSGGSKNIRGTQITLSIFYQITAGTLFFIKIILAEGNWGFFVSSGNKE